MSDMEYDPTPSYSPWEQTLGYSPYEQTSPVPHIDRATLHYGAGGLISATGQATGGAFNTGGLSVSTTSPSVSATPTIGGGTQTAITQLEGAAIAQTPTPPPLSTMDRVKLALMPDFSNPKTLILPAVLIVGLVAVAFVVIKKMRKKAK